MTETNTPVQTPVKSKRHRVRNVLAGVAAIGLLAGSGGTFAVWQADMEANQGSVTSGTMELTPGKGTWASVKNGPIADITSYKATPGETLRLTQPLEVSLEGGLLHGHISLTGKALSEGVAAADLTVSPTVINDHDGKTLPGSVVEKSGTVTAVTDFTLATAANTVSNTGLYDLSSIGYRMDQVEYAGSAPQGNLGSTFRVQGLDTLYRASLIRTVPNASSYRYTVTALDGGWVGKSGQVSETKASALFDSSFTVATEKGRSYQVTVQATLKDGKKTPVASWVATYNPDGTTTHR